MMFLKFHDKNVPYSVFVKDIATEVVTLLKRYKEDPEYISQNKAFKMFGRANVERWRKLGKVTLFKRPGKIEYLTSELRLLKENQQDYFTK